jgi:vacuolar-type H+-ATPase subunit F/Vma7
MSRVAALGRWTELAGYALVGVEVVDARDPVAVRRAWDGLDDDVALVLLTAEARASLPDPPLPTDRLWAVIPR